MLIARQGSRGREIRFLQIALNTHLKPTPKLKVDGVFGRKTERLSRDFQKFAGLAMDGVVGPKTWQALLAPAQVPATNLKKFQSQLGTTSDFVEYLRGKENTHRDARALLEAASNFVTTPKGARYLLARKDPRIIDFRHFFAAASEAFSGSLSRKIGSPVGGSRGEALLLGVANELFQCVDEGMKSKLNSCFSGEDLGSNRLGAEFGRAVKIAQSQASRVPVHQQLGTFLARVAPQPPIAIGNTRLPGAGNTAMEALGAIVTGLIDAMFPEAY